VKIIEMNLKELVIASHSISKNCQSRFEPWEPTPVLQWSGYTHYRGFGKVGKLISLMGHVFDFS